MDAMARLQLARALALAGDTVKAKSAYNDLLTLWENANSKIPMVEVAGLNTQGCRSSVFHVVCSLQRTWFGCCTTLSGG